ncbi:MAG: hypothetical protein DHS20C06_12510 [Hyphobacterium sp.]|nr:MAG: hypothetical protein DHS20C06_12510 [Hyphobacterium sp.]
MSLLSALLIALTATQAMPGAEFAALATQLQTPVQERLDTARTMPAQAAPDLAEHDPVMLGLSELSRKAMRLSLSMESRNGPEDLRCIYRGMAQDALIHHRALTEAEIRADRIVIYTDIQYLLGHAAEMGRFADQTDIEPFTGVDPGCPRGPLR